MRAKIASGELLYLKTSHLHTSLRSSVTPYEASVSVCGGCGPVRYNHCIKVITLRDDVITNRRYGRW